MKRSIQILLLTLLLFVAGGALHSEEAKAASPYMIKINKQQNVVTIYKYKKGKYKPHKAFVCSTGSATPLGTFYLKEKIRWHVLDGPSYGQYCTRITGSILFHSVWYYENYKPNTQSYIQYNRLGTTASHGCVRLTVGDCKWIYNNVSSGTKVVIYNSKNPGPLGKPTAIKVSGYMGWDPTDPDPANPYHDKKPTIKGAKSKNIAYGSKFNVKKGIKVKNSTGFNAKKLLKIKIMYRMDKSSKYKKVSKIDTEKPGSYKVTYSVTDEIKHKAKVTVVYKVLTKVEVSSITLNKKSKTLYLGTSASKAKFTLKVKKIKPKKATTKKVIYSSSDTSVATVSKKGVVKAKKAGTAIITVKAADGSGTYTTCKITVVQYATGLTLTGPGKTLDVGNSMQLKTTVSPSTTSNKALTYSSSDSSIAKVSASGVVSALKPGTVTITATTKDGSKKKATFTITIYYKYAETTAGEMETSVTQGTSWEDASAKLPQTVTISDGRGNTAEASIEWSCENYDSSVTGSYQAVGKVILPTGWQGTVSDVAGTIMVTATASGPAVSVS